MEAEEKRERKIITIPNFLTLLRLLMIPVILWLALGREENIAPAIVLFASGVTDVIDGWIARKFRMTSNVGRILDPVADKLTQLSVLACLCVRYLRLVVPLAVLVVKELTNGIIALVMLARGGKTMNSKWHGKATTVLLYATIFAHFVWVDIPSAASVAMIAVCVGMMLLSFALYTVRNVRFIKSRKEVPHE